MYKNVKANICVDQSLIYITQPFIKHAFLPKRKKKSKCYRFFAEK